MAFTLGLMEENMKENIEMIKNMDMEFIFGPMDGFIKVIGIKENNMVLEIIQFLDNQKN